MEKDTQSFTEKISPAAKKIGRKLLHFADRRKHNVDQNVRLGTILLAIVLIVGIFLPFLSVTTQAGVEEQTDNNKTETEMFFNPDEALLEVSVDDFLGHKLLWDYEIYGTQIDEIEVFGINLYDLAMTPFPDYSAIKDMNSFFNSEKLDILVDEDLVEFFKEYLGNVGKNIVSIADVVHEVCGTLGKVTDDAVEVLDTLATQSRELQSSMRSAEEAMVKVDNVLIAFFIFIFIGIIVLIIGKGPRVIPAILLSIPTAVFIALGIGVAVVNTSIANAIDSQITTISNMIETLGETYLPGIFDFLSYMLGWEDQQLVLNCSLVCREGFWLITLSLFFMTACAYLRMIVYNKRKKEIVKTETVENE